MLTTFEKDMAARATKIAELQTQVLNCRKRLRNLTGALEKEEADILAAVNDGLQLKLDFAMNPAEVDEVAKAKAEKEAKEKASKQATKTAADTGT